MPAKKQDEVRISEEEGEFEITPTTPLRKLERKIESMQSSSLLKRIDSFTDKIFSVTELNQKIIDDVIRSNQGLREDLSVLIGKIEVLTKKMDNFMELMDQAMEIDVGSNVTKEAIESISKPLTENIKKLVDANAESNEAIMQSLDEISKTMKRMQFSRTSTSAASNILARRRQAEEF